MTKRKSTASTKDKPIIIKIISILLFIIASLYAFSAFVNLSIILIIEYTFTAGALVNFVLKIFPTWGFIPIILSVASLIFFYVSYKLRNGSKFSYQLGIGSILAIPIPVALINQALFTPIINLLSATPPNFDGALPELPLEMSAFRFNDPIFIIAFISLILLLLSFKKFQFPNDPLSNKAKVSLIVLALIILIPTITLISLGYIRANDNDLGYSDAQSQVTYHIYKPTLLPVDLDNATKFTIGEELAGKLNAVRVAYDTPFEVSVKNGESNLIVLTQVGVESNFNLDTFVTTFMNDVTLQKIPLIEGSDQTGYLLQKSFEDSTFSAIVYLTDDNVLITIVSPMVDSDELIQFASTLR